MKGARPRPVVLAAPYLGGMEGFEGGLDEGQRC